MGKNKWYFETENNSKQTGSAGNHQSRPKKASFMPSLFVADSPENMPLPKLMHLVWLRLRRSWVALRFQMNRWTFGLVKPKTLMKLGILVGAGFLLFGKDGASGLISKTRNNGEEIEAQTTLEVGHEGSSAPKKVEVSRRKNEAAPVTSGELFSVSAANYIKRYSAIAIGEMKEYGIPASISLAQGLIESRAGTSTLAVSNNNHFGMKCFSKNCKKGHCTNFTDDTHKDFFRKFPSAWESWRAHSQMLSSGRYTSLKRHGRNYKAWAYGLKSIGYATDRTYAEKLIGIIERYNLNKYDR